jgi:chromosomal replication initiator protein
MSKRVNHIKKSVEELTGIDFGSFITKSRKREIMQALTLFIAITRQNTNMTQELVGLIINRDHATIIHHEKKYQNYMETDSYFRELAETISKSLPWNH